MSVAETTMGLLEMDRVSVLRNGRPLLDDVSLSVRPGQHTAILGPNGSGKSTLVRLVSRQLYPTPDAAGRTGRVTIFGQELWDVFELRRRLGVVSPALQGDLSGEEPLEAFDAVISGFFASRGLWSREATAAMRQATEEAMARIGVSHLAGRSLATLSTGEARRVLIARALVHRPEALLLDEPCGGLDPAARVDFLEDIRSLTRAGVTLMLVTHHVDEIIPEVDRLVMLRQGRVLHDGFRADLLTSPVLSDLFGRGMTVTRRGDWADALVDPS
jgi:iron complex transport system ATP-binding protein